MQKFEKNQDRWIKCILSGGNVRGVAVKATNIARELAQMHSLGPDASVRMGESMMAALLVASYCKAGEKVNLNIQGNSKVKQALVDAHPDGTVRGYVIEGNSQLAANMDKKGPWGEGYLSILRAKNEEGSKPYIGTVPMITGHLAKDLSFYWLQSEQVPSAVGLAVNLDETGKIASAGGFLIQALPQAKPEELAAIEQHINELQSLAEELGRDEDPLHLLAKVFESSTFVLLEEKPLKLFCNCSQQRVERALTLMGPHELTKMLNEDHNASVTCDFCSKKYQIDAEALQRLISKSK